MEKERVVVDTYALLAIVYDEVSSVGRVVLERIRSGEIEGLLPVTVAYEYIVHWYRGRIPALKNIDEVLAYLNTYFNLTMLSIDEYVEAARIKVLGDRLLRESGVEELIGRRLSIVDSTVLAIAYKRNLPILTGDKDLAYVAEKIGLEVIW